MAAFFLWFTYCCRHQAHCCCCAALVGAGVLPPGFANSSSVSVSPVLALASLIGSAIKAVLVLVSGSLGFDLGWGREVLRLIEH